MHSSVCLSVPVGLGEEKMIFRFRLNGQCIPPFFLSSLQLARGILSLSLLPFVFKRESPQKNLMFLKQKG